MWTVLDAALKKYHSKTVNHIEAIPSYHRVLLSLFFVFLFFFFKQGSREKN